MPAKLGVPDGPVVDLVNGTGGCHRRYANGYIEQITEEQWRADLHMYLNPARKPSPPAKLGEKEAMERRQQDSDVIQGHPRKLGDGNGNGGPRKLGTGPRKLGQ